MLTYLLLKGTARQYKTLKLRYLIGIHSVISDLTALITEIFQAILSIGRDASLYDVIANFAGCFWGYFTFSFLKNKSV